jgi:pilus assembly protein Flp/PilA
MSSEGKNPRPSIQEGIRMLTNLRSRMRTALDRGASAVEYGLMVAAIAAVIVGIVFGLGKLVGGTFNNTCQSISNQAVAAGSDTSCTAPAKTGTVTVPGT